MTKYGSLRAFTARGKKWIDQNSPGSIRDRYNSSAYINVMNLVAYLSDFYPRYLKAMQLSLGFFVRAPNIQLITGNNKLLSIDIPPTWNFF